MSQGSTEPGRNAQESGTPFGNPDGSRSDIHDVLRDFVEFDGPLHVAGVGMPQSDLSWRVVVGAKGSGKTVYLRRMRASALRDRSLYVDDVQNDVPSTEQVIQFCQCYDRAVLIERWTRAWTCAILRSLVTHVLNVPSLRDQLSEQQASALASLPDEIAPKRRSHRSIYSQLIETLARMPTAHRGAQYLDDARWADLETLLADILRTLPPVYFMVDSLDERYETAPSYWLACQKGLFFAAMGLLRDARLGGRLHVCVTVRDHVLSSVLRSEHAGRYRGSPHIRILNWSDDMLRSFLHEKARRLPEQGHLAPGAPNPMERWLGVSRLSDPHGALVDIEDYIVNHTRSLPRDIVQVGNEICAVVQDIRQRELSATARVREIRRVVQREARHFGQEQLRICANQILSDTAPRDAGRRGYLDAYVPNDAYVIGHEDTLKKLLRSVGRTRLTPEDLKLLTAKGKDAFGGETDVVQVLWQNRLLGKRERNGRRKRDVYFGGDDADFRLPDDEPEYVLHPIVGACTGILERRAPRKRGTRGSP